MEPCKSCACGCIPVSSECIVSLSELPSWRVVSDQHVSNAVDDIDDLLGLCCSEELCQAIIAAIAEVNTSGGTVDDYLADRWLALITNRHFKKWFANRVAWHWFEGSSITELKKVGLITASNTDEQYKNGFQHAEEAQRKRLQGAAANYASGARKKFLEAYWFCNLNLYACAPKYCWTAYPKLYSNYVDQYGCRCGHALCTRCNVQGEGGRGLSVGMDVI